MKRKLLCLALAAVLLLGCLPLAAQGVYTEMGFSDSVVEYVEAGEGFSPRLINDGTGWYIGYGCLVDPAEYPNGITEEDADALLRSYMQQFADYLNLFLLKKYDLTLTQGQFDALIAISYALGPSWMKEDTRLHTIIVTGPENYSDREIACAFAAFCHVGSRVNTVALQRRIMEAKIFLYDDYTFESYGLPLGWNWLILDPAGGENDVADVAVYPTGETYGTLPTATLAGKYFAGWAKSDGTALLPTDTVSENLTLTALWSDTPVALPEAPAETPAPVTAAAPTEAEEPEEPEGPEEPAAPELPEGPTEPETPAEDTYSLFPDVSDRAWYAPYVEKLVLGGVVNGYDDGLFRPDSDVTWGQALKLVLLSSGFHAQNPLKTEEGAEPSHWASGYLELAEARGYVPRGSVADLDAPITRNEIADLTAAALELEAQADKYTYADSTRSSALKLFAEGIMEGSFNQAGQRVFLGSDRLKRSEVCAVLVRVQDYVARTWILFAGYRIPINYDLALNTYDRSAFYQENGRTYYDDGVTPVRYGIDVSWYQGAIDWARVAADGVSFAIIRCGCRGYGSGELSEDSYFRANVEGALANGIDVGVYFFSQATSVAEAREELAYTLDLIRGYNITMPVVFDWEQMLQNGSRTQNPDWGVVSDCIAAFCDGVSAAGYTPMCYYNPSMAYLRLDLARLQKYPTWLAHYVEATNFCYAFQMWQYGSSGSVDGISGRVDMDILFADIF